MAMWANTPTDRFTAIVAGAGLSNWVSYYGTNGINTWMLPFFGKPLYDDYDAYRRVSAVNYVKNAKTPTFIYFGERDIEVPPTQSIEWWHALKDMADEGWNDSATGRRSEEHKSELQALKRSKNAGF